MRLYNTIDVTEFNNFINVHNNIEWTQQELKSLVSIFYKSKKFNKNYCEDELNIYRYMKEEIKQRVIELFKPALERIKEQSNCDHLWKDKDGSAYFRCEKCGFLAQDKALDRLIFTMKLMDKGLTPEMIKKFKDYI